MLYKIENKPEIKNKCVRVSNNNHMWYFEWKDWIPYFYDEKKLLCFLFLNTKKIRVDFLNH